MGHKKLSLALLNICYVYAHFFLGFNRLHLANMCSVFGSTFNKVKVFRFADGTKSHIQNGYGALNQVSRRDVLGMPWFRF